MSVPRIFEQLTEKLGWTIERYNSEQSHLCVVLEIHDRKYSTTLGVAVGLEFYMRTFGITKEFQIPLKYDIGGCENNAIRTRLRDIEAWSLVRLGRKQPSHEGALHFKWVEKTTEWTSLEEGGFVLVQEQGSSDVTNTNLSVPK